MDSQSQHVHIITMRPLNKTVPICQPLRAGAKQEIDFNAPLRPALAARHHSLTRRRLAFDNPLGFSPAVCACILFLFAMRTQMCVVLRGVEVEPSAGARCAPGTRVWAVVGRVHTGMYVLYTRHILYVSV